MDTLKAASAGGDTFQFGPSFGGDTVTGFHAGDGTNHDFLDFHGTTAQSRADLTVAASASGHDTVITLDAGDTILLKGVVASALTDLDFHFA
jgi:serralysin